MEILLDDYKEESIWETWGPSVLARWIQDRPGSRPSLWWKYTAPRLPAKGIKAIYDGKLLDLRQQVGGAGTTKWEGGENWIPYYFCGLPATKNCWMGLDPNEPPVFESQASYLKRHGLLTPEEEKALESRPEAFEPEIYNILK